MCVTQFILAAVVSVQGSSIIIIQQNAAMLIHMHRWITKKKYTAAFQCRPHCPSIHLSAHLLYDTFTPTVVTQPCVHVSGLLEEAGESTETPGPTVLPFCYYFVLVFLLVIVLIQKVFKAMAAKVGFTYPQGYLKDVKRVPNLFLKFYYSSLFPKMSPQPFQKTHTIGPELNAH